MKSSLLKKSIAFLLAALMLFTAVPAGVFAAEEALPVMKEYGSGISDYRSYYSSIYSATFLNVLDWNDIEASDTVKYWDSSANGDKSVITYIKLNEEQTQLAGADRHDLFIAGDGGISANARSRYLFYDFEVLEEVNGCENFDTLMPQPFTECFLIVRNSEVL